MKITCLCSVQHDGLIHAYIDLLWLRKVFTVHSRLALNPWQCSLPQPPSARIPGVFHHTQKHSEFYRYNYYLERYILEII